MRAHVQRFTCTDPGDASTLARAIDDGTEGVLSPHYTVFSVDSTAPVSDDGGLLAVIASRA